MEEIGTGTYVTDYRNSEFNPTTTRLKRTSCDAAMFAFWMRTNTYLPYSTRQSRTVPTAIYRYLSTNKVPSARKATKRRNRILPRLQFFAIAKVQHNVGVSSENDQRNNNKYKRLICNSLLALFHSWQERSSSRIHDTHTNFFSLVVHRRSRNNMQTLILNDYASAERNHMHYSSFGWGDMPYQGEHHDYYQSMTATTTTTTTTNAMLPESFFRWSSSALTPNNKWVHHSLAAVPQQPHEQHTTNNAINNNNCNATNARKRQRIRFAEHVQVRTHETILGYHPACTDGLALQCGWAYAETEYTPLSPCSHKLSHKKKSVREMRLDQMTRRQRLREVTGMSNLQLLQLANELLDVDSLRQRRWWQFLMIVDEKEWIRSNNNTVESVL